MGKVFFISMKLTNFVQIFLICLSFSKHLFRIGALLWFGDGWS